MLPGDDPLVKIKSLQASKIMKIKWLVLGCIDADCLQINTLEKALDEIYQIHIPMHLSDRNSSANFRHEFQHESEVKR